MADPVDIDVLVQSYRSTLLARIQVEEFRSWGSTITDTFKRIIADHQILEETYLREERERRKG